MKQIFAILVFILVTFGSGSAQSWEPDFVVYVDVKNGITRHKMDHVRCHLQTQDSIDGHWGLAMDGRADYFQGTITVGLSERPKSGKYRVYVQKMLGNRYDERYETGYVPVEVPEDAESGYRMPTFYMQLKRPKEIELNEVTVKATKVKFYHKGDTLVYNADAFLLAEGSMLDALLNQMPGVELKSNGIIYCNGKQVQQLLLNGKDVFNGKFGEMLDNLPAYTVKDIAVYNKQGRVSEMMGIQTGDANYVMDVRLKREYAHGGMANADAGYGTEDRYLAKLFGLWYSDNVSVSANATANNLSDDRRPAEKDNLWSSSQMSNGLYSTRGGGINYLVKGAEDKWEMKGSVDLSHTGVADRQTSSTEYFDGGGNNTYKYAIIDRNTNRLRLATDHELLCNVSNRAVLRIRPKFYYNSNRIESGSLTASFRNPVDNCNRDSIENIYDPFSPLAADVINRMKEEETNRWSDWTAGLDAKAHFKLKSSGANRHLLMTDLSSVYTSSVENAFNRYGVNFGDNPILSELSHRHYHDSPDYRLATRGKVEFMSFVKKLRLSGAYQFSYSENKKDSRAYNLEQLADYDYQNYPLECLPDGDIVAGLLNPQQSYQTLERNYKHSLDYYFDNPGGIYLDKYPGRYVSFIFSGGLHLVNQTFDYIRIDKEYFRRQDLTYDMRLHSSLNTNQINAWEYSLSMSAAGSAPNLNAMASLPSRNPLEIETEADRLSRSHTFDVIFGTNYKGSGSRTHGIHANAVYEARPIYTSFDINQTDGVMTLTQANGRFRFSSSLGYDVFMPLRRNSPFTLSSSTSLELKREVMDNRYTTGSIVEKLKLSYQHKSLRLTAFADGKASLYRYSFQSDDSRTLNLKYGLDGLIKLPQGWDMSTDFTLFTRRGYLNTAYNATESVWNLRVSKTLHKGSLILALDAYDLLHQVSNLTYVQNNQLRTETIRNGVPAYILFHIRYQFNHVPKHH